MGNQTNKNSWVNGLLALLIIAIPPVYTAWIYQSLPEQIPTHFNIDGAPDQWGHRSSIWTLVSILGVVSLGVYLLVRFLPNIDPKKTAGTPAWAFQQIALVVVVFLSIISVMLVHGTASGMVNIQNWIFPLMGLFFATLGYYMARIRPNYFVGFRLPWTLEDPENWKATHRLVGQLWVPGGILIALITWWLSFTPALIVFLSFVTIMTIVPAIFSYQLYRKSKS